VRLSDNNASDFTASSARIILSSGESKSRSICGGIKGGGWNGGRLGTDGQLNDVGNSIIDYVIVKLVGKYRKKLL
jgi:hypothetical protein